MPRALWTAAAGMNAQQLHVDLIANNIANVNTTGFKRQRADFQDLYYDIQQQPGARIGQQGRQPTGTQIGTGVVISGTTRVFTAGNIEPTGRPLDVAIEGDGFFQVQRPDGSVAYTRAGDFRIDAEGRLVTADGYFIQPAITVPDGASENAVFIAPDGTVTVTIDGAETVLGQISLARFRNPGGLLAVGRNLFEATEASGAAVVGNPTEPGFGSLRHAALEKANVEAVTELVNLIMAQRAYDLNSKSITTADQMLRTANDLVR
ncbi:MAG: flagellar basal-body rod protein FlgG [Planctomycetota bacterium]|nr:flagellar basal-body rod protein FlgG [Planctomycetota bacterium]MDW8373251.1 flagellar basal-body rod protein FlgG [Planctomycetota bacterium]